MAPLVGTLVVLAGKGDDMQVLTTYPPDSNHLSLPTIPLPSGEHPYTSLQKWLQSMPLPIQINPHSLLPLKGFLHHGGQNQLHASTTVWLEQPSAPPLGLLWQRLAELEQLPQPHGAFLCEALGRFWPAMPSSHPAFFGITPYGLRPSSRKSATFFGGSFSPWHRAHRVCLELCPDPESVIVVPDSNPQKDVLRRPCPWACYQALIREVTPLGAVVFPGFVGLEHSNPTVGWLPFTHYSQRNLLMGDDSLASFPTWIHAPVLAQSISKIWVVPRRSPQHRLETALSWFHIHAPNCTITFLGDHPFRDISSTDIRRRLSQT